MPQIFVVYTMRYVESFTRRRLPHWDVPDAAYFITTCLDGSIPAAGLLDLERCRAELDQRPRPKHIEKGRVGSVTSRVV